MVRKMELRPIEDELSRQLSFAKRRNGLVKKALELFTVCGVDCVFISFSPSGRLSYFFGDKRVEDVLARFATIPEHIRRFHLTDHELHELLVILNELKERTNQHLQNDRTVLAIQREICKVKAEIESVSSELSEKFEPLPETIMTIEEANNSEAILEETLAKVHDRMKELSENQDNGVSQPSNAMIEAENSTKNPSNEAHHVEPEHEQGRNSNNNTGPLLNQSPAPDRERRPTQNMLSEMNSPHSGMSFSSLLMATELPENLSPIRNPSMPGLLSSQPPDQNNGNSFSQNQYGFVPDSVLNAPQIYQNVPAPEGIQSSGQNGNIYGTAPNGFIIPNNNLPSPNYQFPSTLASFQAPPQNPFQLQSSNSNAVPPAQSAYYQMPPQMPLEESSRTPLFNGPQWPNQNNLQHNQTLLGQLGGYQGMLNSVSDANSMYPQDAGSPAAYFRPPNLPINNSQPVGSQGMGPNLALNLQGSLPNTDLRKSPWEQEDIALRLSNNQNMNLAPNNVPPPTPRQSTNAVYNTAYELMGLPIDPHFRMIEEMTRREGSGSSQQPPNPNQ
ncbi:hypothetical protein vseg_008477 [Gypsophila vaccaria]